MKVDQILNTWFGEPPEYSKDEHNRLTYLYDPLRQLEHKYDQLATENSMLRKEIARLRWSLEEQD